MNTNTYTFRGFDPVILWFRDCDAWNIILRANADLVWANEIWLSTQRIVASSPPRGVSIIASLLTQKARYG